MVDKRQVGRAKSGTDLCAPLSGSQLRQIRRLAEATPLRRVPMSERFELVGEHGDASGHLRLAYGRDSGFDRRPLWVHHSILKLPRLAGLFCRTGAAVRGGAFKFRARLAMWTFRIG
jgi:hypothetical protein